MTLGAKSHRLHDSFTAAGASFGVGKVLTQAARVELVSALAHEVIGLGQGLHADGAVRFLDGLFGSGLLFLLFLLFWCLCLSGVKYPLKLT
jgi:hypothetical protein